MSFSQVQGGFGSMNAMRRLLLAVMVMVSSCAYGLELPGIVGEWRCVKEHVVPLVADADGSDLGRMVYRDYAREAPAGNLQVILTEGRGTGSLYVPDNVNTSHGAMPSDAGYKIVDIGGRKAILEQPQYLPAVLAVSVGKDVVITIETNALGEDGITEFAERLFAGLNS